MASDRKNRLEIVQFGRMLHENGFVAATDGNLSVRLDDEHLLRDSHLHKQGQDARFGYGDCGHGRETTCRQAPCFE